MRLASLAALSTSFFFVPSAFAFGFHQHVPEIDSAGSLTALAAVAAFAAVIWERRRRRK